MDFLSSKAVIFVTCIMLLANKTFCQELEIFNNAARFGNEVYKELSENSNNENVVHSPLSAYLALSMLINGAQGDTKQQLSDKLCNNKCDFSQHKNLQDELVNSKNVTIKIANKLYVGSDIEINKDYDDFTKKFFNSAVDKLKPDATEAAREINNWVDEATEHKISQIVDASIDTNNSLLLFNTIYFKADWSEEFSTLDFELPFNLRNNETIKVPVMTKTSLYKYAESEELGAKYVEIPYKNENVKMVIIVPTKVDGLPELLKKLQTFDLKKLTTNIIEIELYVPKFNIKKEINYETILTKLGMADLFTDKANFAGITRTPLKVNKVIQKTVIEVNERGTEAGAVTEIDIGFRILTKSLFINQPFYFALKTAEAILFEGHVTNPLQG